METKNTFSKAGIIRIIEDDPKLEYFDANYRSTEKRLNKILQFYRRKKLSKHLSRIINLTFGWTRKYK